MIEEYGVGHSDGTVTVVITGDAFMSEHEAREEADQQDDECLWCDGDRHPVLKREVHDWNGSRCRTGIWRRR